MFISVLDLFKIGIGPSSSHTLGPMVAAYDFIGRIKEQKLIEVILNGYDDEFEIVSSLVFNAKLYVLTPNSILIFSPQ